MTPYQRVLGLGKPSKRSKKPPKRIARGKRPGRVRKTSRGAMGRKADALFSKIVREPDACGYHGRGYGICAGPLQCAHLISRSYRSVRWDENNAIPLCAGAHRYFTNRPVEWERFILQHILGAESFEKLKRMALDRWDGDIEGVLVRLASRAVVLGLVPESARGGESE